MISDNDLLLYHYGEGLDAQEREHIRSALAAQPALAARLHALVTELDSIARTPDVPLPAAVAQRWQDALNALRETERPRSRIPMHRWAVAGAACLALIAVITLSSRDASKIELPVASTAIEDSRGDHGLQWHLASTEQQLTELSTASDADRARLVRVVVEQNRLFAAAAERAGDQRLARALRSFAPILENLAEPQSADAAPGDLAQLSFELRVIQARLAADSPAASDASAVTL